MSDFCEIKHTAWANYVEKCSQSTLVVLPFVKMKTVSRILGYQNYCLRICWKMLLIPSGFFFTFSENENDIVNITKSKTLPEIRQQMLNLGKMKTISYREYKEIKNTAWTYVEKCSWLPMVVLPFVKIRRMSCSLVPCYIDFTIFLFSLHTFTFG